MPLGYLGGEDKIILSSAAEVLVLSRFVSGSLALVQIPFYCSTVNSTWC